MKFSEIRRIGVFFAFIFFVCSVTAQQISVTGGEKTPLMVVDNNRFQVYLVYGVNNVQISYTSSSTSHQWFRFRTSALNNPEKVSSTQNGTTSFITNVEEGYGYFVNEYENMAMNHFVWIIDYSKYEFDIRNMNVSPDVDQCMYLRIVGDADIQELKYYTPAGSQEIVRREFELIYGTLEWNETLGFFENKQYKGAFNTNPFTTTFPPPLTDTEITLTGDLFARHFGVEKSITIPYQAIALEVHADTTILSTGSSSFSDSGGDGVYFAPTVVNFRAVANIPNASFQWNIYKDNDTIPFVTSSMPEFERTFNNAGTFVAKLRVYSTLGTKSCTNDEDEEDKRTFKISITETEIVVPNAFSPGTTPGVNDIFKVKYKSVVDFKGWVFNRWGNELFHWTDITQGWDGMYRGKYVPAGAYYYLIEYTGTDGKKRVKKGDINVFRSKTIDNEINAGE